LKDWIPALAGMTGRRDRPDAPTKVSGREKMIKPFLQ
jgi:hypothetical protein